MLGHACIATLGHAYHVKTCMVMVEAFQLWSSEDAPEDLALWWQQQDRLPETPDLTQLDTATQSYSPSPPPAGDEDLGTDGGDHPDGSAEAKKEVMPAPPPRAMHPGATAVITLTTHRREFMALNRVATGPRALQFPEVAKMFLGSKVEQRKVLAAYVNSGENLDAVEADMTNVRTHSEKYTATRKLMTIKQMIDEGFSEIPGCMILLYLI